jgi:electron transfer flavoprotein alpha subunit
MARILVAATLEDRSIPDDVWALGGLAKNLDTDPEVALLLMGTDTEDAAQLAAAWFDEVIVVDDPSLSVPDGERFARQAAPIVQREQPALLMMVHTNFAMDAVPGLSALLDRPLITDCLSLEISGDTLFGVRTMYAGKVHARMEASLAPNGCVVTVRPGAFEVPSAAPQVGGRIRSEPPPTDSPTKRRYVRTVEPDAEDVDLSQAEILVAVGRGIEDGDNIQIIENLAEALGAEIACSRPVVDNNWLPKTRQVGTAGVTVRPRIYLAVGISGSFQHMGGVKGNPFIAAINSDPRAPIFNEADVGIVGDLFDVVPVLTERIRAVRS